MLLSRENFVVAVVRSYFQHHGPHLAAIISFYALMSLVPLMMIMASLAGYFLGGAEGIVEKIVSGFVGVVPAAEEELTANLHSLMHQKSSLGIVGSFFLLFIATLLVGSLEHALDTVFQSVRRRNFLHSRLVGIGLIAAASLFFFMPTGGNILDAFFQRYGMNVPLLAAMNDWGFFFLIAFLAYVVTVVIIPNHTVFLRYAVIGGLLFAGGIAVAKSLFRWYLEISISRYNVIYGSLTVVVTLVLWIYSLSVVMLLASEVVALLQTRRVFHWGKNES